MTRFDLSEDSIRHIVLDVKQMKSFCDKPLIFERAEGIHLFDTDGKRYIDGISGIYVVGIGHRNQQVLEAIRQQQDRICFAPPMHAASDVAIEYARRLARITPGDLNTIKLLSGGSEATETAIKFARQYHRQTGHPNKHKVLSIYEGYHGGTLGALSATGFGEPRKRPFEPLLEGFVHLPPPFCLHCPYGLERPTCNLACATAVDYIVRQEHPDTIAALIIEPICNTGGLHMPPDGYLESIRQLCTKHNILLVFDEIITGMGRTGNWFAADTLGVEPDILCMGKGLSSGYAPLAATAFRDELYYAAFWGDEADNIGFAHGHTYGANPQSAAAGLAVLDVLETSDLIRQGAEVGQHIRQRLERDVAHLGILREVRGVGALSAVEFAQDMSTGRPFPADYQFGKRVEKRLITSGLLTRCDVQWISFAPPFITTIEQADEMLDIFCQCVADELKAYQQQFAITQT